LRLVAAYGLPYLRALNRPRGSASGFGPNLVDHGLTRSRLDGTEEYRANDPGTTPYSRPFGDHGLGHDGTRFDSRPWADHCSANASLPIDHGLAIDFWLARENGQNCLKVGRWGADFPPMAADNGSSEPAGFLRG
jgi:hypothetical protein